LFVNVADVQLK